ncbi:SRPBCC family protein [Halosimplex salinum]|uniref:SRPBCC family protein n=1 Tax=Halosimplex salinum TaxID=1710538 RepID=UPI000F4AE5EA|nr:SRPBCC family protein [Halosimplex salinum]
MQTVTVSRRLDASPERVREAMEDLEEFMLAAGFTDVSVDGADMHLENQVGLATVTLDLRVVDSEADLAYEQADGFFEVMDTEYWVEAVDGGSEITATTDFALDVALVGQILDATVIKRQRRHELEQQFDWLAEELEAETPSSESSP